MVQVEELEARFADFDEFVVAARRRSAPRSAAHSRRARSSWSRRATAKPAPCSPPPSAFSKASSIAPISLETLDAINGYFAADSWSRRCATRSRSSSRSATRVKADDLQSRLKTVREDAVRQLKDRQELFAGGTNVIQLGRHQFLVNTQELDLTIVPRGEEMCLHLTGTNFFEPITDAGFPGHAAGLGAGGRLGDAGDLSRGVPRASRCCGGGRRPAEAATLERARSGSHESARVRAPPRYAEGYVKGVHDQDAAKIFGALARDAREPRAAALSEPGARLRRRLLAAISR